MSRPVWLPAHCVSDVRVLPFPAVTRDTESQAATQSELGAGLTYASPENLILEATHVLERIVRLAGSLSEDQITTVLGDLLTLETQRLEPLQAFVERHRAFLSDLSCKQARKRRRRQKRVRQDVELSA